MTFPKLELLEYTIESYNNNVRYDFNSTIIVAVQHLLESTGSLFESLIKIGFIPNNIFLIGKAYSTNEKVFKDIKQQLRINIYPAPLRTNYGSYDKKHDDSLKSLWREVQNHITVNGNVKNIIIIDDGGQAISRIPRGLIKKMNIVSIEQTTRGVRINSGKILIPIINVAESAAKAVLESQLIASTIVQKIKRLSNVSKKKIGVVGIGNIGSSVLRELSRAHFDTYCYDVNQKRANGYKNSSTVLMSIQDLVHKVDIVLGCTGKDISKNIDYSKLEKDLIFASCSTSDIEFNMLLKTSKIRNTFRKIDYANIELKIGKNHINILNGGYPINFDRTKKSVKTKYIQLTRALLLCAIFQIIRIKPKSYKNKLIKLSPSMQKKVSTFWMLLNREKLNKIFKENYRKFNDTEYIGLKSKGVLRGALR